MPCSTKWTDTNYGNIGNAIAGVVGGNAGGLLGSVLGATATAGATGGDWKSWLLSAVGGMAVTWLTSFVKKPTT